MFLTISQVIYQFRLDEAVSLLFHCDFNFEFDFEISSSRTSFHSLEMTEIFRFENLEIMTFRRNLTSDIAVAC